MTRPVTDAKGETGAIMEGIAADVGVDSSTTQEQVTDTGTDQTTEVTPEVTPEEQVPFHQHPRWQEVQGELKQWKQFGDPRTVAARLEQLNAYEQQVLRNWERQQVQQAAASQLRRPPADGTQYTQEEAEARNYIKRLFPELDSLGQAAQNLTENIRTQQQAVVSTGRDMVGHYARQLGVGTPAGAVAIENALTALIESDPQARQRFVAGDTRVVEQAWLAFNQWVLEPVRRSAIAQYSKSKDKMSGLPGTSAATDRGTPASPTGRGGKELSDQEAVDLGYSMIMRGKK